MEALFGLIGLAILYAFGSWALGAIFGAGKAAVRTATGKGTLSENMQLQFKGMGPLAIRPREERFGEEDENLAVIIEARGLIPVNRSRNIAFVTSVLDATDGDPKPILCHYEDFQEDQTFAYQARSDFGAVQINQGFLDWVRVGVLLPDLLDPPKSGKRKLTILIRLIDTDDPDDIHLGFGSSQIWGSALDYEYEFEGKGYEEVSEDRDRANALALQLGVAVAMADGTLHDKEGEVLNRWVLRKVAPFSESRQEELKEQFNSAMKDAYEQAIRSELSLSEITSKLREIDEKQVNLDAVELGYEIMSADGKADKEELEIIKKISDVLGIDPEEQEKFKDQHILKVDASLSKDESPEALVGLDRSWPRDKICAHLTEQFQKWNGRLNILDEGPERDQAQRMIDIIGELRAQYCG